MDYRLIHYDEYELLELFESEPIIVFEEETGVFIYRHIDSRNLELTMSFSVYENKCSIGLSYCMQAYDSLITEIDLEDVTSFLCTSEKLTIQRACGRNIEVIFKPNFILKFIEI